MQDGFQELDYRQSSEFFGTLLQFWTSSRFYIEGGSGIGIVRHSGLASLPPAHNIGFTALIGAGVVLYDSGIGFVKLGLENTFVILDEKHVNNLGLSLGYQLR
ncbi:MAG: hypothetical protein AB8G77_05280 [Rhodothermales bacterium]